MLPYLRYVDRRDLLDFVHPICNFDFNMIYVIRGEFSAKTPQREYILKTNDVFITPPAVLYQVTGLSEDRRVYLVNYDLDQSHSYFPYLHSVAADIYDSSLAVFPEDKDELVIRHITGCDFAKDMIRRIFQEYKDNDIYYNEICNGILYQLLYECKRWNNKRSSLIISEIIDYISNNYTKKISNKTIADNLGYHTVHINRLFKKHMGTTIHQYVIEYRLKEARRMLMYTDKSIAEISYSVGFDYPEYFTKVYKDYFSVTPTKTRSTQIIK